jgi:hypothetical protein
VKQQIFDIETLGSDSNCICLLASFLVYDLKEDSHTPLNSLRHRVKTFKLSIDEQSSVYQRTSDPDTVKWWKEQLAYAPQLKSILSPTPEDLTVEQFYEQLSAWLVKQGYNKDTDWAWQRGTLDIMVLDSMFKQTGLDQKQFPIHWWKIRDLRTAIDLTAFPEKLNGYTNDAFDKAPKVIEGFAKHDPVCDVLMEVMQLRDCGIFNYDEIPF